MKNNLFNSDFAKHSKFDTNFVGDIIEFDQWLKLATQFKEHLNNISDPKRSEPLIPKKIHQIWLGANGVPKKSIEWMKSWKKYNPDWEYKLWNEENIKELEFFELDVYSKRLNPGYRSDILRYVILDKYGGLYVDTDFECVQPIPSNILNYKFVAGLMFGNKPCIGNSILMSSPNSIFLKEILNKIKQKPYKNDINHIIKNSGPEAVTREYFSSFNKISNKSLILPSNYFYPFPNFMLNKLTNRYDEIEDISIGIHHWEMTWMKGNLFHRIKNKLKAYLRSIFN